MSYTVELYTVPIELRFRCFLIYFTGVYNFDTSFGLSTTTNTNRKTFYLLSFLLSAWQRSLRLEEHII